MKKGEILAPAGSLESLTAAVRCGADAVYLGGKELSARKNAANFSFDELVKGVSYCHARGVKVYFAVNTLVGDRELEKAQSALEQGCLAGVDAFIVQDLGVAALARECAPEMPLHASTQMSVHTLSGVRELEDMGFKRVVLAREMSLREIEEIAAECKAELEVFVHGALCMCVSGQCYLSAVLGGRSGNRGLCAQPCRLPFTACGGTGNDLSLKDLSIIEHLKQLSDAGVTSFKIEGRMKRPEYVAAAVESCKSALEGKYDFDRRERLRSVFSRSGFTDGYFTGHTGREMFGKREKDDVAAAKGVLSSLENLYRKEVPLVGCEMSFYAAEGENMSLAVKAGGKTVFVTDERPCEKAVKRPTSEEEVRERLNKTGGTPFYCIDIDAEISGDIALPASSVNNLRREALERLEGELGRIKTVPFDRKNIVLRPHSSGRAKNVYRFASAAQIPQKVLEEKNGGLIFVPLPKWREGLERVGADRLGAEVPRGMFGKEETAARMLSEAFGAGVKIALCGNIGSVRLAREAGFKIYGDFGLNIMNTLSLEEIRKMGVSACVLSFEMTLGAVAEIGGDLPRGIIAYGRLPLMLTRNCPAANGKVKCSQCGGRGIITDRKGTQFPVMCSFGCSELLNSRPLYMGDRLREISNADFRLLRFTDETREEAERVLLAYEKWEKPTGEFTRGLYYRGVE